MIALNQTRNVRFGKVKKADKFLIRFVGLIGANPKKTDFGLFLTPCNSIHTIGMAGAIDAIFLSKELKVVRVAREIRPFSIGPVCVKAHCVLEGFSRDWKSLNVSEGDQFEFQDE